MGRFKQTSLFILKNT